MSDGEADSILPETVPKLVLPDHNENISDHDSQKSDELDQASQPLKSNIELTTNSVRFIKYFVELKILHTGPLLLNQNFYQKV